MLVSSWLVLVIGRRKHRQKKAEIKGMAGDGCRIIGNKVCYVVVSCLSDLRVMAGM